MLAAEIMNDSEKDRDKSEYPFGVIVAESGYP